MSANRLSLVGIALAVTAIVCEACPHTAAAVSASKRPNVLFILTDDQRPDTIRALGNSVIETPHLDALVREGTVFTRAVSPNPVCVPSRGEILSGCTGFRNGVFDNGNRLNPALVTWPQAMRAAGYRTCLVGKWHLAGRPTDHGFDETRGLFVGSGADLAKEERDEMGRPITGYKGWVFEDDAGRRYPERGVGLTPNISSTFADATIDFLRVKRTQPFFLNVNFTAPHDPLFMPSGYVGKYDPQNVPLPANFLTEHPFDHGNARGRDELLWPFPRTPKDVRLELAHYYAVISHMDAQIGRILKSLDETGQTANTLVVFASDQGLAIGSHGLRGKQNMYDHTVGVPLILHGPGIPRGVRRSAQVYLRDLYPTICELAGVPLPASVEARSFASVVAGDKDVHHERVFGYFRDTQRMIRDDRWKLIDYPAIGRRQLFDVERDPLEMNDLAASPQHAEIVGRLTKDLTTWQTGTGDPLLRQ